MTNLYEDLGVPKTADKAQIKGAYRKKARKAHPDAGGDPADFHAIAKAYEVLGDDARRARYDETGATEIPRTESAALGMIDSALEIFLQRGENAKFIDVVGEIRKSMGANINQAKKQKNMLERSLVVLDDARKRFKSKDANKVFFKAFIDRRIDIVKQSMANTEEHIAMVEMAIELLKGVSFDVESGAAPRVVVVQTADGFTIRG